jgi:hypothetical protein
MRGSEQAGPGSPIVAPPVRRAGTCSRRSATPVVWRSVVAAPSWSGAAAAPDGAAYGAQAPRFRATARRYS